jgi:solute carrier family 9 (sodium/hydrogen exchanger), member 8
MLFEGFIFLYFGLGLLSFGVEYDPLFVLFAILAIFIGRAHVFVVCWATQFLPGSKPVPMNQQLLMWFSGLRGAVAFALAVSFLEEDNFSSAIKGAIFGTTVLVILFTVIGLGGLTPYLLEWLEIVAPATATDGKGDHHAVENNQNHEAEPDADVDQTISETDLAQPIFGWLYLIDMK